MPEKVEPAGTLISCRAGPLPIPWLERGWRSKRLSLNFMNALHYGQRLEQAIRMRNCAISPEVRDPDLLRKVV